MGLFNKTPEKKYVESGKKIRKIQAQIENLDYYTNDKKENKLKEQLAVYNDIRKASYLQLKNPTNSTKTNIKNTNNTYNIKNNIKRK